MSRLQTGREMDALIGQLCHEFLISDHDSI